MSIGGGEVFFHIGEESELPMPDGLLGKLMTLAEFEEAELRINPTRARRNAARQEYKALGPLMKSMQELGDCAPTDELMRSSQRVNRRRWVRVWRSLIYEGPKLRRPRRAPRRRCSW